MYIAQVVIMSVIIGYMAMTSSLMTSTAIDMVKSQKQAKDMVLIESAVLMYFDQYGSLPSDFDDVSPYLSLVSSTGWKDADGAEFQILDNAGSTFSFQGVDTFMVAIVAPGRDGIDSSISSNVLSVNDNETVYLIPEEKLQDGFRGDTYQALNYCNNASVLYQAANSGSNPSSVSDLTSAGMLEGKYAFDGKGELLQISAGACYSMGWDGADDGGAGDDLT